MPAATVQPFAAFDMRPERPQDAATANRLIAAAFGPGRFAKAAERLREGGAPAPGLSFIAWDGDVPAGCVRLWPIAVGDSPALLLGPFAVDAAYRGRGLGGDLVRAACAAAQADGRGAILLVGDLAYFKRNGFARIPVGQVTLPGPVDRRRLLWRALRPGALDGLSGDVIGLRL